MEYVPVYILFVVEVAYTGRGYIETTVGYSKDGWSDFW